MEFIYRGICPSIDLANPNFFTILARFLESMKLLLLCPYGKNNFYNETEFLNIGPSYETERWSCKLPPPLPDNMNGTMVATFGGKLNVCSGGPIKRSGVWTVNGSCFAFDKDSHSWNLTLTFKPPGNGGGPGIFMDDEELWITGTILTHRFYG